MTKDIIYANVLNDRIIACSNKKTKTSFNKRKFDLDFPVIEIPNEFTAIKVISFESIKGAFSPYTNVVIQCIHSSGMYFSKTITEKQFFNFMNTNTIENGVINGEFKLEIEETLDNIFQVGSVEYNNYLVKKQADNIKKSNLSSPKTMLEIGDVLPKEIFKLNDYTMNLKYTTLNSDDIAKTSLGFAYIGDYFVPTFNIKNYNGQNNLTKKSVFIAVDESFNFLQFVLHSSTLKLNPDIKSKLLGNANLNLPDIIEFAKQNYYNDSIFKLNKGFTRYSDMQESDSLRFSRYKWVGHNWTQNSKFIPNFERNQFVFTLATMAENKNDVPEFSLDDVLKYAWVCNFNLGVKNYSNFVYLTDLLCVSNEGNHYIHKYALKPSESKSN